MDDMYATCSFCLVVFLVLAFVYVLIFGGPPDPPQPA